MKCAAGSKVVCVLSQAVVHHQRCRPAKEGDALGRRVALNHRSCAALDRNTMHGKEMFNFFFFFFSFLLNNLFSPLLWNFFLLVTSITMTFTWMKAGRSFLHSSRSKTSFSAPIAGSPLWYEHVTRKHFNKQYK